MKAAKIVVLGGNGFVGQRIVNCALRKQASVVGISRSGAPPKYVIPENIDGGITLKWHKADVFDVASWKNELEGADAVVSCIGAFGSNEFMEKMNGDANIIAVSEALNAGVQRFVYISTVENNLPDFVLKGYFHGKKRAEQAVIDAFQERAYVLRPGFMYGTRDVPLPAGTPFTSSSSSSSGDAAKGVLSIPLWMMGRPLEAILSVPGMDKLRDHIPGMKAILARPLNVDCVASVAAAAALGELRRAGSGAGQADDAATAAAQAAAETAAKGNVLSVGDILKAYVQN